jgi:hypothetical protein
MTAEAARKPAGDRARLAKVERALRRVGAARTRYARATAVAEARRSEFEDAVKGAAAEGVSLRAIEAPSGLKRSQLSRLVRGIKGRPQPAPKRRRKGRSQ